MPNGTPTFAFMRREWRFLSLGALIMFWTGPGQTYLISLFGDQLRQEFRLSHGDFGSIYTFATLTSAALLWSSGRLVDRVRLGKLVAWVCVAMTLSTMAFSLVTGPISLFFGILLVRFLGQGMMSHIAVTAMARRYIAERGRAIAIAGFGFPLGEGLFPPLIILGLGVASWQTIWLLMGLAVAVTLLPSLHFLLQRPTGQYENTTDSLANSEIGQRQWTRGEMLRDKRFFLIAPLLMTMSAIFTGIVFHQKFIVASVKGWDFLWWSICFSGFAVCQLMGSFATGWLVDRISAQRIAPFVLAPFAVSIGLLGFAEHAYWVPVILCNMGLSAGATNPTFSSLLAELYGTLHLGAIRAAAAVLSVFASALGPVVIGWTLDAGVSMSVIALSCFIIILGTSCLAFIARE